MESSRQVYWDATKCVYVDRDGTPLVFGPGPDRVAVNEGREEARPERSKLGSMLESMCRERMPVLKCADIDNVAMSVLIEVPRSISDRFSVTAIRAPKDGETFIGLGDTIVRIATCDMLGAALILEKRASPMQSHKTNGSLETQYTP